MTTKSNGKVKQAEIITHLKYIKENVDKMDKKIDKLNDKMDSRVEGCNKRFNVIEHDVDTTKGFAKGAAWMGGTGIFASVANFILRYMPK